MANLKVYIVRTAKIDGKWKYLAPVVSDKGRVSPEFVMHNGQPIRITGGLYYICWNAGKKKMFQRCGSSVLEATEAKDRQEQVLRNLDLGIEMKDDGPKRLEVSEAIEQFYEELRYLGRKRETLEGYRLVFENFDASCKKRYLDQIDRRDMLRFADSLRKLGLAPRTVSNRWLAMMAFFKSFHITGLTKKGDAPRYVEPDVEAYEPEDIKRFFPACDPEQHLLYSFYLKTGFREKEVAYTQYSDLNFRKRTVSVNPKPEFDFIPKSYERRTIPLEEALAVALESRQSERKLSDLVFPTRTGKPCTKHLQALKRIVKNAGEAEAESIEGYDESVVIEPLDPKDWWLHKFRATFATWHLQAGVDIRTVSKWLGHKDIQTTMRYLKPLVLNKAQLPFNATFAGL